MSSYTTTFTGTPIPRSEPAFTLLGVGNGPGSHARQAHWMPGSHVAVTLGQTSADTQVNPIFNRVRVNAAKQGSPPRGIPR